MLNLDLKNNNNNNNITTVRVLLYRQRTKTFFQDTVQVREELADRTTGR